MEHLHHLIKTRDTSKLFVIAVASNSVSSSLKIFNILSKTFDIKFYSFHDQVKDNNLSNFNFSQIFNFLNTMNRSIVFVTGQFALLSPLVDLSHFNIFIKSTEDSRLQSYLEQYPNSEETLNTYYTTIKRNYLLYCLQQLQVADCVLTEDQEGVDCPVSCAISVPVTPYGDQCTSTQE
ncbi:hypothetical protein SS50377_22551 [Spironucleus salmonicida]|uniref:Uncharacterized protein n=1 Tax=Spironucleus salmonicida TaxID=348837 RepID=V6LBX3_9EUKA|nr:hypothetical protein SS50377_22551 [Spironucleus salmonicida]|eukprot:EST41957.1 Hypothetical protein SS50377_18262 [Spironucleus salmonicida]